MASLKLAVDPALCRQLADWASGLATTPGNGDSEKLRPRLRDIASQLTAAAALGEDLGEGPVEITDLRLCEAARVVLHPDRLYRFTVAPECRLCEAAVGAPSCAPSALPAERMDVDACKSTAPPVPLAMLLWCPQCNSRHVDEGDFATKPHHTHACQGCGHVWRPAIEPTCGVQFLPGFKNAEVSISADVISEVVRAVLDERKLHVVKPQHPTMGEIALEAYGFGKACDAVALQGDDLQALLLEIGTRGAESFKGR